MRFRLVVFDLDGTLIDSRRDLAESANEMLAGYGAPALPVEQVTDMVGEGARLLVQRACAAAGLKTLPDDALARFLTVYGRRLFDYTRPYAGVVEMLRALSPRVRLAVLTNKPQPPAERLVEGFGFAPYLASVIGGDGGYPRKPAAEGLLALIAQAGVTPAETLMVGDSRIDFETAERAGTGFCLARYGFGVARMPAGYLPTSTPGVDAARDLVPMVLGDAR